jgi:hypothetical protein
MILKGSQRGGASQLAAHLLNDRDNDHVRLHELRGFVAHDLRGALREAEAVSKGTRCTQFMFSVSLNPPKSANPTERDFEKAADRIEKAMGLEGQPRAMVIHEKEGRRHAHAVWPRIDAETMRAINLPFFKRKLTDLSRDLYLDHGWTLPDGLRPGGGKNPLNFTLEEWQQAKRLGTDPRAIKAEFREAFDRSDGLKALRNALEERGYYLAQGDRRDLVAIDLHGEIHSVARRAGVKTRELRDRIGALDELPRVDEVQASISSRVTDQLRRFSADAKRKQQADLAPLHARRETLRDRHRAARETLARQQAERWQAETKTRAERFRRGLGGLWDRLTGKAASIRRANEAESASFLHRDSSERDTLVLSQMGERRALQADIETLRLRHLHDRRLLSREIAQAMRAAKRREEQAADHEREMTQARRPRGLSLSR